MKLKMKKMIWIMAALCWWGTFFPELSLGRDTCRIVWTQEEEQEEYTPTEIYYKLLSAEPNQIKMKSRLLEILAGYLEKGKGK